MFNKKNTFDKDNILVNINNKRAETEVYYINDNIIIIIIIIILLVFYVLNI